MNQLNQHIEALIFCSEQSISLDDIAGSLKLTFDWEPTESEILHAISEIKLKYESEDFPFGLEEISEGYQFLSKKDFHPTISALIQHKAKKKLSVAQMETLSIIAYKQPITKSEIEHIRGVNCDYAIHKLLEKDLISISGKSEGPGRPVLYSTSKNFMDYFGLKSAKDLPQLKDIHVEQNEIGPGADTLSEVQDLSPITGDDFQAGNENAESFSEDNETVSLTVSNEADIVAVDSVQLADASKSRQDDVFTEVNPDVSLPDRKNIFMESQNDTSDEESVRNNEDEDSAS
ncbi:MAG: SMC-Scp complex subunit ScpB [Bacteroidetes bacterium]|nr:MAG: SMC-Scp complex subunit ScpB [Bacteroidota bacterium]REK04787.1 MAG: SMC-Scp complex subunit ScpB [Bacteroidota bacterium]REK36260.1 MAG: SMC-Scp complex subunit ScpB [Bacteroidota bacterium]REK51076.1 MAG: SMC-Scp complex subunit ScpB [Bacteroidota bacterium]